MPLLPTSYPIPRTTTPLGWGPRIWCRRSKEIRGVLQDSLPHYAVPSVFAELEALYPGYLGQGRSFRTPAPPPRPARRDTGDLARLPETASRPEKEALLVGAWEDVLRLDKGEVGPEDNFFDLGGHSLAAAQLFQPRAEQGFGGHVSMPLFMEDPTPGGRLTGSRWGCRVTGRQAKWRLPRTSQPRPYSNPR